MAASSLAGGKHSGAAIAVGDGRDRSRGAVLQLEAFSFIYGKEALGFGDIILVAAIAANLAGMARSSRSFFFPVTVGAIIGVLLKVPQAARSYAWARAA